MNPRPALLAVTSLALLSACAHTRPATAPFRPGPEGARARARTDSLRYPYTKADIDFMSGMIHHHAQAIQIAGWAPTHGASPAVIRLGKKPGAIALTLMPCTPHSPASARVKLITAALLVL